MHTATAAHLRYGAMLAFAGVVVGLACGQAGAASAAAPETLPICRLDPHDSTKLAAEPCRTAPPVQPRRSVVQAIGRMPVQGTAPPVVPAAPMPPGVVVPMPGAPQPIGSCDTGGCRDASGTRYNGAGNATLDANGRICHRNGAFMQCF